MSHIIEVTSPIGPDSARTLSGPVGAGARGRRHSTELLHGRALIPGPGLRDDCGELTLSLAAAPSRIELAAFGSDSRRPSRN
eukprot:766806-Hanusia_phi.AAC.7